MEQKHKIIVACPKAYSMKNVQIRIVLEKKDETVGRGSMAKDRWTCDLGHDSFPVILDTHPLHQWLYCSLQQCNSACLTFSLNVEKLV